MSSGRRGKKRKQRSLQQNELPDLQVNEQGHPQGGSVSSVKPALEQDGTSQNIPGGRSIGHIDKRRNATAEYNIRNSGNKTTTNSNNTIESTRNYNESKNNEFTLSEFHGTVHIGDTNNHSSQLGPLIDIRTRVYLEKLVQTISWDRLSSQLCIVDQDEHRFAIPPFNRDKPERFWVSKNIDFTQWESANDSRVLLLSAPPGHGTTELCSHLIDLSKTSQPNNSVLYFFFSTVTEARRLTAFTHTLLHQIVSCSNVERADSIAATFLNTLLGAHFQQPTQAFKDDDDLDTIQKILQAPDNVLIEALVQAIKKAGIQELSIIVDDLSEDIAHLVIKYSIRTAQKLKALFTIDEPLKYGELPDKVACIEYDKERQECLRSLQYDDTRYDKISEEHRGSLEWLWEHPQYLQWSTSATSSLLYIEGKPGSGKSTLAKYFLKNLKKVPNACSSTVAHYFYTFRGTVLESTHENMLRSILHSILEQDESAFFHFQQEFRDSRRRRNYSEWPYESLKKVLSSFGNNPPTKPLYLILDAMDESKEDDRRSIIQLLCNLCSKENRCCIKVCFASRPVAELKLRIREHHHIIIMQDQNMHDISRFADDFLTTDLQLSGKILHDATEYITKYAQGVFVWVSLIKYELLILVERGLPDAEILKCLKGLPKKLEDFYNYMFDKLQMGYPRDIQDRTKLFRLVLFALRPLSVLEIRDALALPDDHNASYEDFQQNISRTIARRIEYCGGNFLEIKADETVQFMHQTAREFLIRTIPDASKLQFEITDKAHGTIITTSVRYLMLCFTSPRMPDDISKITSWSPSDFRAYAEYLNEWPLVEYALRYIKDRFDLCSQDKEVSQLVTALFRQLIDNPASHFLGSFIEYCLGYNNRQAIPVSEYQETSEKMKYNTLNAAAEPKLAHIVEALLLTCTQDAPHAEQKTPLIISAQKGLAGATQLFLDHGIDKDAKDNSGWTALHHAAGNGWEAIVQLLMGQDANKRIRDNHRKTALHIAVEKLK
ncbi:hypothetical protein BDD12DRAFT_980219 [Trichophaea hybrida]|nr:hypothetical protein BDD12DRAFT_980219 [Trichophaea hybrida]